MICSCMTLICVAIWQRSHCLNVQWLINKFLDNFRYYKKKFKILGIKTSEIPKNIKKLDDSLFRNYWNKIKYTWLNNREI